MSPRRCMSGASGASGPSGRKKAVGLKQHMKTYVQQKKHALKQQPQGLNMTRAGAVRAVTPPSSSSSAAAFSSFSFSKEMPFEPNETSTHAGLAKKLYSATASKSRLAFASFSESTTTLTRCGVRQSANQDERGGIGRVSVTVCTSPGTIMGMTVSVALVPKSTLTALTLKGDSVIASPRFSTDTVTFIVSGSSACSADTECGITTLFHSG
mmetsp:Transcript_6165/g.15954  ORF Transcript_6165/g.15954 Transcript_6165/m.15954 type:complete len:211 (-) Transcript_6165:1403-2035(-)